MMKFFRKYNKEMLVALLAFLIVIWLAGDALNLSQAPRLNPQIATSRFGDIDAMDQANAQRTTQILANMGYNWNVPVPVMGIKEPLGIMDWILATREAESLGAMAKVDAVLAWQGSAEFQDRVAQTAHRLRVKTNQVLEAVRDLQGVQLAARSVGMAASPSLAELRAAGLNELDKVKMNAVVIPASAYVDKTTEFSDAELTAHFEKYRKSKKGEGLEFGYVVPPTVKIQYIKIDRDALSAKIGVANLDKQSKAYYDTNKDKPLFRRPAEPPMEKPAEGEAPSEPPAEKPPQYQWDEPEAQKLATDIVRKQLADEIVQKLADWLIPFLSDKWVDKETGKDGYKVVPEEAANLAHYSDVLKHIPASLNYPEAVTVVESKFFSAAKARDVADIGPAVNQSESGRMAMIGNLAFKTKGLVPTIPQERGIDPSEFLATYQTCRLPLKDVPSGNMFVFRVIDTREEHPADSLDEVRAEVIEDLRLVKAYEVARKHADDLRDNAMMLKSLKDAFEADQDLAATKTTPGGGYSEPDAFSRLRTGMGAAVRPTPLTFVSAAVGRVPNDVVDEIFNMASCEDKAHSYALPQRAAHLVAEFVEHQKGRIDEFDAARDRMAQSISEKRISEAIRDWLTPSNIKLRTGFAQVQTK